MISERIFCMEKYNVKPKLESLKTAIETIAEFKAEDKPGNTRRPFTKEYKAARLWLKQSMEAVGLSTKIDAASNLIGSLPGSNPKLKPIMIGSHTDTVMGGGRFDGIIGVLGGIEIVRVLKEAGIKLEHPLEIVDFTAEEPSDFGMSTIGSKGMVGELSKETLQREDAEGHILFNEIDALGGNCSRLEREARKKGEVALYLELHIEQGPVLEQNNCKLGVVTGIVGIHRYRVEVEGKADHAGTIPMDMRRDALTMTSELILYLEKLCREKHRQDVVGTVGKLDIEPNASNVIPGKCVFEFEVRSLSNEIIEEIVDKFIKKAEETAKVRALKIAFDNLSRSKSIIVDEKVQATIKKACEKIGSTLDLPSGAGHDANHVHEIAPVGMIFVPSKDGRSHCPEEFTTYEEITLGVEAILYSLLAFDEI